MPAFTVRYPIAAACLWFAQASAAPFAAPVAIADAALPSWNSGHRVATAVALYSPGGNAPPAVAVLAHQLDRLTLHPPGATAVVLDAALSGGSALAVVDAGADGDDDLVAASRWQREILLYANSGGGSFGARQVIATGVDAAVALVPARIDADAVDDLLVLTDHDGRLFWLRGAGGGFDPTQRLIHQAAGTLPGAVAVADLDGDGDHDIVLQRGLTLLTLMNPGDGNFAGSGGFPAVAGILADASELALARLDADALPDLLLRSRANGEMRVLRNLGAGNWAAPGALAAASRHFTAGDLDGDGDADLLLCRWHDRALVWLENRGELEFAPARPAGPAGTTTLLLRDADADGDPELFSSHRDAALVSRHESYGSQPYLRWATDWPTTVGGPGEDASGDGQANLLAYAFGYDPLAAAPRLVPGVGVAGLPVLAADTAAPRFEFVRRRQPAAYGLVYLPETSGDLLAWSVVPEAQVTVTALDAEWERVSFPLPAPAPRFARVRLLHPTP